MSFEGNEHDNVVFLHSKMYNQRYKEKETFPAPSTCLWSDLPQIICLVGFFLLPSSKHISINKTSWNYRTNAMIVLELSEYAYSIQDNILLNYNNKCSMDAAHKGHHVHI